MDGAAIASLVGTVVALAIAGLAYIRGRLSDDRKADTTDFVSVTSGMQTLIEELRSEVGRLRQQVRDCESDKTTRVAELKIEVRHLKDEIRRIQALLRKRRA